MELAFFDHDLIIATGGVSGSFSYFRPWAYNAPVPTPFNHIVLAERIRGDAALAEAIREHLDIERPAFLLGNTAPDFGSLTGRDRASTHFFSVPIRRRRPAHLRLLDKHPELAEPTALPPAKAAFLAGYLAHLWLDQLWISTIFEPYFARVATPGSFHSHLVAHNLLRAHLDRLDRDHLPTGLGESLREAEPGQWLPFAPDGELNGWRDHLAGQLAPGGAMKTVEVFAQRLGIEPEEFVRQLNSARSMSEQVFDRLPEGVMRRFWAFARAASTELVQYYLEDRAAQAPTTARGIPRQLPSLAARTEEHHESYRAL